MQVNVPGNKKDGVLPPPFLFLMRYSALCASQTAYALNFFSAFVPEIVCARITLKPTPNAP